MMWKKKGNRIRASDKSLVYHFCIGWLFLLFVAVFLLLNLRQLLVTDWKDFNLLQIFSITKIRSLCERNKQLNKFVRFSPSFLSYRHKKDAGYIICSRHPISFSIYQSLYAALALATIALNASG